MVLPPLFLFYDFEITFTNVRFSRKDDEKDEIYQS